MGGNFSPRFSGASGAAVAEGTAGEGAGGGKLLLLSSCGLSGKTSGQSARKGWSPFPKPEAWRGVGVDRGQNDALEGGEDALLCGVRGGRERGVMSCGTITSERKKTAAWLHVQRVARGSRFACKL